VDKLRSGMAGCLPASFIAITMRLLSDALFNKQVLRLLRRLLHKSEPLKFPLMDCNLPGFCQTSTPRLADRLGAFRPSVVVTVQRYAHHPKLAAP
jgi:hypothetical protein